MSANEPKIKLATREVGRFYERHLSLALSPILQMAERVPRAVLARKYSDMVKQVRPGAEIKVDFVE